MAEVKIQIKATDDASGAFTQASAGVKNFSNACKEAQSSAFDFIKGLAGWEGIKKIAEWMKEFYGLGAQAQQAEESFRAVTASFNVNADSMLSKMKQVSMGMIDESDMMQKAVQGLMLGLKDDQIVNLLEASRNAAKVLGNDIASTFDSIIVAVGGGVRAMGPLVRMGLITKDQFELLNKAVNEGAENIDLYKIVMANAAIQRRDNKIPAFSYFIQCFSERNGNSTLLCNEHYFGQYYCRNNYVSVAFSLGESG